MQLYPKIDHSLGKNGTKHILIMPDDFKKVVMRLPTTKGGEACDYFIQFEKIVNIYFKYQREFLANREKLLEIELKESREQGARLEKMVADQTKLLQEMKEEQEVQTEVLDEVVDKLDKATDERAPRTKSITTHGQFMLIELNSSVAPWQFYVIRAQRASATRSYKSILEKYPKCVVRLTINYQPNAVNLFNLIKEELKNNCKVIKVSSNYIKLISGYTKDQFIDDVIKINEDKKEL
jgi:hypothetical protein